MTQETSSFEVGRAILEDYLDGSIYPARLDVTETLPLQAAVDNQQIAPDTRLLTFEHNETLYTIPMQLVLSYNVIQGTIDNTPWMMTFCNACNTGMVFDPTLDGQVLHFRRRGAYDGLLLIWDEETDSYWQHITGQCLHGDSAGRQLRVIATTRQMTAAEVLAKNLPAWMFTSLLTEAQQQLSRSMEKMRANPERLEAGIISTVAHEDTRRPRFELGLGIWNTEVSSFIPLVMLHTRDNVLTTEFDGRRLLVYQTPDAIAPTAVYLDVQHAYWEQDILRLDNGASIRNDLYYTSAGRLQPLDGPMQLLVRWYGFALTFPGCDLPHL